MSTLDRAVRSVAVPAVQLVLWLLLYLSLLLGGWVLLGWGVGGWTPVVVSSGSMEPTLSVGDVLLVDGDAGPDAAQRSIIVFERDGQLVAHRVFSVERDSFVTKGDANPTPDAERVAPEAVLGAGRLVVPAVGLPAIWASTGQVVALGAWFVVMIAGVAHLTFAGLDTWRAGRLRLPAAAEMSIAQQGIRRVRQLVAVLVVAQYVVDPARLDVLGHSAYRLPMLGGAALTLVGTNFLGSLIPGRSRFHPHLRIIELVIDTVVVVTFATLTGTSGIGWVLFALPIIEAAVSFRLVGALTHWIVLTGVMITGNIWTSQFRSQATLLEDLEIVVDQLSILFLVVVPGAYLAEQLVGDVVSQQHARDTAVARSAMLERVAEAGREVARLGAEHVTAIVDGAAQLGFDVVDVQMSDGDGAWHRIDCTKPGVLPKPGRPASGLRAEDEIHRALLVDTGDPELSEVVGLRTHDLGAVLVETLSENDRTRIVLRAGLLAGRRVSAAQVEAFRLLAGQAAVALDNDQLLAEVTAMHEVMEHKALHDHLTHLPNRTFLLRELREAMSEPDALPAVLFLDLDGFKPVNDRLGHDAGDDLLRFVANRLQGACSSDAVVARIGGDEFAIMVPGPVTEAEAQQLARTVWVKIRDPFEVGGDIVRISTSVGIAFAECGMAQTELIRRADVAMYRAKSRPDDTFCELYHPDFDLAEERRGRLIGAIPRALASDQLHLVYQPIHWVTPSGEMWGVEALIRWTHPTEGVVPPPQIIEVARAAKILNELSRWIIVQACSQVARWVDRNPELSFFLTVNASPEELASRELVTNVAHGLQRSGLPGHRLHVEISEQLVSPNVAQVVENMEGLQEMGVGLLLDDFGEGQTSLSYIHELPVAGIKLDRRLVVNTMRSETDRIVLRSVVELCHRLDLVVVAEGIESAEQLEVISECGCNLAQGYLLSRPELPEVIADRLFGADSTAEITVTAPAAGGG